MLLVDLVLGAVATWSIVEAVHHGSLFAPLRKIAQKVSDRRRGKKWLYTPLIAILCPFCFSYWAAMIPAALLCVAHGYSIFIGVLLWYGGARLSNLLNDITSPVTRTPGRSGSPSVKNAPPELLEAELYRRGYDINEER